MPVQAIGALAVAPSKPNIVWAGTGEAWAIRDADLMGDGVYKSTDSGKHLDSTWASTRRAALTNLVDPANSEHRLRLRPRPRTGPQQERGVFRTTDGGRNWEHVLFVDENTGCSGLTMDAHES